MKPALTLLVLLVPFCFSAQPLRLGMTVATQSDIDSSSQYPVLIYDTRNVAAGAPQGNNWGITPLLPTNSAFLPQWKYSHLGDIFGVTIDAAGNIYLSAGNMYNYTAYFGAAGAGGIYRINANDWSVTDFVHTDPNPTSSSTTLIPNTGSGLGNITYDKWHDQLFVTNFEDGKIYRIDMNGTILSKFDPFQADAGSSQSAPLGDRPWGIGVYTDPGGQCRVYFSDWTTDDQYGSLLAAPFDANTVWSVALDANGEFTGTEQLELTTPGLISQWGSNTNPVSCINFSSDGKMLLAERTMQEIGLPGAHNSRWLEYENTTGSWTMSHLYQVGNFSWQIASANSAGGADFAYLDSDASDSLNGCEQLVWGTADAIRFQYDNPDGVEDYLYGMTGVPESGNSTNSSSPDFVCSTSYMIDFNNDLSDIPKTHLGSVAVYRDCKYDPCENYRCTMINVVTPNEDGHNDKFVITCIRTDGWKLEVYDRWGYRVYKNDNYQNDWDCAKLKEGVYYYILTTPCEEGKTFTGFFHLLRSN